MQRTEDYYGPPPDLPDISQMNMTMNPGFIDDGADYVDVHVGENSRAESARLAAILSPPGVRARTMPPLSMPRRIVHGNVAIAEPAYQTGVLPEHAITMTEYLFQGLAEQHASSEEVSPASTDESESSSSDSGCERRKC